MNIRVRMIFLSGLIPPLSRVHTHLTYGVACTGGLDVMLDVAGSDATFEFEVSAWISLTMSSIYGFHTLFLTLDKMINQLLHNVTGGIAGVSN
jgi:hypothetical protein